jgi:iron complex outermembrane receptor protein
MKQLLVFSISVLSILSGVCQNSVSGVVTSENGNPLVGASIFVKNAYKGSVTNSEGFYQLDLDDGQYSLSVQHLGYKTMISEVIVSGDRQQNFQLELNPFLSDEFVLEATRLDEQSPFAFQNLSKEDIEQNNLGQDLPILLNQTISAVTTSDAGAGVGYTGIRIRGSDATRINVTVNGVPINDAESHGVFWVNMPDFAGTTENIQIQRGVGTSSNGAASFGASINMETTGFDSIAFVGLNNSYGSFNTRRHNAVFNSGLVSNHFNFEGRLSYIASDGYIDRSASDLRSYYFAGGYYRKRFMLKGVVFSGREVTQQAWWGTPQSRINNDDQSMINHAANNGLSESQTTNLLSSGRTYNYYMYQNEIDNYSQSHYQLISGFQIIENLYLNVTGHYTRGLGYFEQSKPDDDFEDYGLTNLVIGTDTISSGDFVVRRWLDNHFYGGVYSLKYSKGRSKITLGGSYNEYVGDHYGEIIWSEFAQGIEIGDQYYFSDSKKSDLSNYIKSELTFNRWSLFGDVQYRYINYKSLGIDNDQRVISISESYHFLNPKLGVSFSLSSANQLYASVSRASREPVRNDFTDAAPGVKPKAEYLTNGELGWTFRGSKLYLNANTYLMYYTDQLVLTGEVNDVGSPVRTNVSESYRGGIELSARVGTNDGMYWQPNLTLSQNKILDFDETILDYTNGFEVLTINHVNSDIAFSPGIIAGSQFGYRTKFGLHFALLTKYVGKQYLDNTSNDQRSIPSFWTNDILLSYNIDSKHWKNLELNLLVNNVLNHEYESNGYTYSYIFGSLITENFYYPQAGVNWLAGLKWRF